MLTWIVIAIVVGVCLYLAFANAGKPRRFQYQGQTYYRAKDGSFLDADRQPIRDATLIAALGVAFAAVAASTDADASWSWDSSGSSSSDSGSGSSGDSGGGGD